ncbi:MAG: DUF1987 domain-containing protein [Bacteroidales bacterium]|nr:DUF1987 domain-containing protein [Bacteroidales bacterium]
MDNLIINGTDFTPKVAFLAEAGHLELSGISRPEDVAGFYEELLQWLGEFEEFVLKSEHKYEVQELRFIFNMSYFNSSSSKFIIQMLRHVKNLIDQGIDIKIDWFYEEGDEKMMEDGEDLADAVELEFNYIELED